MRQIINFLGIAIIIVFIMLISCKKDSCNNTCNVTNPAEEIGWLKEAIDNAKQHKDSYFVMAKYKGETVFYYGNCNPAVDFLSNIQNCNGDNLGFTNDLYDELTDRTILWKHEESECHFQE